MTTEGKTSTTNNRTKADNRKQEKQAETSKKPAEKKISAIVTGRSERIKQGKETAIEKRTMQIDGELN